ncbi:MAG: hypothetical protein GY838_00710 [bacterium]|nr:hypothetical protein [bacterium]
MNSDLHDNQSTSYESPPREAIPPRTGPAPRNAYKSPVLATVLSMMPGVGQIYVGYYPQGFMNIMIVASTITLLAMGMGSLTPLLAVFLAFFWIYNMIDANRRAQHYNRALDGLGGETLPDDFEMPGLKGSMPLGVVLIVAGSIFFLDRKFGMDMEWLEEWWPIGLVIAGVWLVVKARSNKD